MERREKTLQILNDFWLEFPGEVPLLSSNVELRPVDEMVHRAISLFIIATYSDVLLQGNCPRDEARTFADKFINRFQAQPFFTTNEINYLDDKEPTKEQIGFHCWRWESLFILLWILGFTETKGIPVEPCSPGKCQSVFSRNRTTEAVVKAVKLRTKEEILDEEDLLFMINSAKRKCAFERGVLLEWIHVIDWAFIRDNQKKEWDNITQSPSS